MKSGELFSRFIFISAQAPLWFDVGLIRQRAVLNFVLMTIRSDAEHGHKCPEWPDAYERRWPEHQN